MRWKPDWRRWLRAWPSLAGIAFVWLIQLIPMRSFVQNPGRTGFYDWDVHLAYRYSGVLSVTKFHEGPWWNPWLCGGYANWGYPEGATAVATPMLLYYLALPPWLAIRLEAVTMILAATVFAFLFASRYLTSPISRTLVALLYAANSRWFLQIGVGHLWFLVYALLPLALWLFERAIHSGRVSNAFGAGAVIALGVYAGGTYPITHTALAFGLIALARAYTSRSVRPLLAFAVAGHAAFALAAPKLLPIAVAFGRLGRPVASQTYGPAQILAALTHRAVDVHDDPAVSLPFGQQWYETGIFIGWGGVVLLLIGAFFARGRESRVWNLIGWCFAILSAGSFHAFAPWSLLHRLPVFWSQHVPLRFFIIAVLALSVAACRTLEGALAGSRRIVGVLAVLAVAAIGGDMAHASSKLWEPVFKLKPPRDPAFGEFRQVAESRLRYDKPLTENDQMEFAYDWPVAGRRELGSMYLSMLENEGVLSCYGIPAGPRSSVDATPTARLIGVTGVGDAELVSWSPSRVVVDVRGASPGAHLVYNMNFDEGWRANGEPAIARSGLIAKRLDRSNERVVFAFTPPGLWPGLVLSMLGIGAWVGTRRKTLPLLPF